MIQRVSTASVDEIDRVISELQHVRETLRREGERVQREITGYAGLSQAAMSSMKIIAENLQQWKAPAIQHNGLNGTQRPRGEGGGGGRGG